MSVTVKHAYEEHGPATVHPDGNAVAITDQGALFVWPDKEQRERHHEEAIAIYAPGQWANAVVADESQDGVNRSNGDPTASDRLAVDGHGYVWRVNAGGTYSMARTNPDNSPIPSPVTYYEPTHVGIGRSRKPLA